MANFNANALATAGRQLEEAVRVHKMMEEEGASTDEHMKAMWEGKSNILVTVRVRPLMKHDIIKKSCVRIMDGKVCVIVDPANSDKADILRAKRNNEKQFAFDYVFEPAASQEAVFMHTTKFLIHGVLDGYNATVFAYGQTGSGKTHTMIGSPQDPGIMVRVMDHLFAYSLTFGEQNRVDFRVTVSFLEVYNENIRDLLSETEEYLDLREDPIKGPMVAGITEVETGSSDEIMKLLQQGNARRSQAATAANEVSSRSHAVLQVIVENKDKASGVVANIKVGKLSLVDLAGSERAANTKNTGARLVEGANINRSLLALGNCINALGEKGNKGNFVPYRDSKLTRLLKDSLGGNCRTVMIANISSSESSFEETSNTLKYANRAKNIKTNVQRNVLNVNYHISEYVQLIDNLRNEIKVLKDQLVLQPQPLLQEIDQSQIGESQISESVSAGSRSGLGLASGSSHHFLAQPSPLSRHVDTPLQALRESMKSAASMGEGREVLNRMRQQIVENFQEKMQLRRSLIELEDQNVQNSIEVSKRQLVVVQWCEFQGISTGKLAPGAGEEGLASEFSVELLSKASPDIKEAWQEVEQIRKAMLKNNAMKRNISKRLRHNEREAEKLRDNISTNVVTNEDRRELMELQYQVGRLELENMELEQHRIVHDSVLKGKDLTIQKLMLQLAVRDKIIQRQQAVLKQNDLDHKVGYAQLSVLESTLIATDASILSPPRHLNPNPSISNMNNSGGSFIAGNANNSHVVDSDGEIEDLEGSANQKNFKNAVGRGGEDSYFSDDGSIESPRVNNKKAAPNQFGNNNVGNNKNYKNNNYSDNISGLAVNGSNPNNQNSSPLLPGFMRDQIQGLRQQGVRASRQLVVPGQKVPGGPQGNINVNSEDFLIVSPNPSNGNNASPGVNGNSNQGGDRVPLRPHIYPLASNKKADMLAQNINILNGAAEGRDSDGEGFNNMALRGNAYAVKSGANNNPGTIDSQKVHSQRRYPLGPVAAPLGALEDVEESPQPGQQGSYMGGNIGAGAVASSNNNNNSSSNNNNNNNNNSNNNNKGPANMQPVTGTALRQQNPQGQVASSNVGGGLNSNNNNNNNGGNLNQGNPGGNNPGGRHYINLGNAMLKNQGRSNASSNNSNNNRESYSDDDFMEESGGESDSDDPSRKNRGANHAKVAPMATINEENSNNGVRGGGGVAPGNERKNLGKLKFKQQNSNEMIQQQQQQQDPLSLFLEGNIGLGKANLLGGPMVNNNLGNVNAAKVPGRSKVITKTSAASATELGINSVAGGQGNLQSNMGNNNNQNINNNNLVGQNINNIVIPKIGERNRSLPNLSKQNSGPNSSRSQGDRK